MILRNVEHDLSLAALFVGTSNISFTSNTNNFWDVFDDEIIFIASFIPTCFSSKICIKVFSWVFNSYLTRSLLKSKTFDEVRDQNLLHATLLKAVFLLSEEFQCSLSAEIYYEYSWQRYQLLDKKLAVVFLKFRCKFYRNLFFLIMTQTVSFSG